MKHSTKIWMAVAGGLLAAGIIMLVVGCAMGGYGTVKHWIENGELSWNFGFYGWNGGSSVKFNGNYPVYEGNVERTPIEGAESARRIERLCFDAGGGLVEIRISEDGGYWFSSDNAKEYQCYAENGSLELRVKGGTWMGGHSYDHVVTLWLPADESYREINLDIGGGVLTAEELDGDEISIDVGAGRIEADALTGGQIRLDLGAGEIIIHRAETERLTVDVGAGRAEIHEFSAEKLEADLGAGQIMLNGAVVRDADISVSMGEIVYSGTISGDLDADCSMGEINLELTGKEEDHNYDLDCSMGDIRLGSEKIGGAGASRKIDNGAGSTFELDCSMGGINVKFGL